MVCVDCVNVGSGNVVNVPVVVVGFCVVVPLTVFPLASIVNFIAFKDYRNIVMTALKTALLFEAFHGYNMKNTRGSFRRKMIPRQNCRCPWRPAIYTQDRF